MDYGDSETTLDNTIFYIRLANDMQRLLNLSTKKTMEFISESNRILQMLEHQGELPFKVFDHIRRFASFIAQHKNHAFSADIDKIKINDQLCLYCIQPPCGSNTYIFESPDELVFIDTGYAVYYDEMLRIFQHLFTDFESKNRRIYITHADVDHCGLLSKLQDAQIFMNSKSAESIRRQYAGQPDFRETNDFCFGYSKLSQIISDYTPVDPSVLHILDSGTPQEHEELLKIGSFNVGDLVFDVLEGSGGHVYGEMIFFNKEYGIVFTGDNLVNISGFTTERAEFNSLAPFLMTSVNIDSEKAKQMREDILSLIRATELENKQPAMICGGHGPISSLKNNQLICMESAEKIVL
jgi:glyoxylase-like metal-dependent hydrolase (beta-lactamase superfamily II)